MEEFSAFGDRIFAPRTRWLDVTPGQQRWFVDDTSEPRRGRPLGDWGKVPTIESSRHGDFDVIVNVAAFTVQLCNLLEGELLGDFRFRCGRLIIAVAPYGPAEVGAMHVQPSPGSGDLEEPAIPGIVVRRGRSLERVVEDIRWLMRPPTLLETLVKHISGRPEDSALLPEQVHLYNASEDFKKAESLPGLDPLIETYSSCREAAYVAALTAAGALDHVDLMMAQLRLFGVDPTDMAISRDPANMKHSWQHTVGAARLVGAWSPRGRAGENRRWRYLIEDAIHAIRRGDEASRRRCVAMANKARGAG